MKERIVMDSKYRKLEQIIEDCGSMAVAYSGGTDSTLLMHAARSVLGDRACAITAKVQAVPLSEIEEASVYCRERGIRHSILEMDQLSIPGFAENTEDRCYICKKALFTRILSEAERMGYSVVAEGSNADDSHDYRPGMRAIRELGVVSPLLEAGLAKQDIYRLSEELGLPTASKPSYACLATRIPYGDRITEEKLRRADLSEQYLRELGFGQVRVRVHGPVARIEAAPSEIGRFMQSSLRESVCGKLKEYGFSYVSLDLSGYRTGSMNEVLDESLIKNT